MGFVTKFLAVGLPQAGFKICSSGVFCKSSSQCQTSKSHLSHKSCNLIPCVFCCRQEQIFIKASSVSHCRLCFGLELVFSNLVLSRCFGTGGHCDLQHLEGTGLEKIALHECAWCSSHLCPSKFSQLLLQISHKPQVAAASNCGLCNPTKPGLQSMY